MLIFLRESSEKNTWVDLSKVWSSGNVYIPTAGIDRQLLTPDRPSTLIEVSAVECKYVSFIRSQYMGYILWIDNEGGTQNSERSLFISADVSKMNIPNSVPGVRSSQLSRGQLLIVLILLWLWFAICVYISAVEIPCWGTYSLDH